MSRSDAASGNGARVVPLSPMDEVIGTPAPWWWRRRWIAVLGVVLIVSFGVWLWHARAPALPEGLQFALVQRGDVTRTGLGVGEFVSLAQVAVPAAVSGSVVSIARRSGDTVQAGAPLLTLENPQLRGELERAQLELRRTQLEQRSSLAQARSRVAAVQSALTITQRRAEVAHAELKAQTTLAERGIVSKLALLKAQAQQAEADAATADAERAVRDAGQALALQAHLQSEMLALARSRVDELAQQVQALTVRAPSAGVVKSIRVQLGDALVAGKILAEVGPLGADGARLRFPASDLSALKPGVLVMLHFNGQRVTGHIERVDPDLSDGYAVVEVRAERLPADARVGLAVRGEARLGQWHDVLYARSPYSPGSAESTLWIEQDGRVRELRVRGMHATGEWLVLPADLGIRAGDRVALEPPQ